MILRTITTLLLLSFSLASQALMVQSKDAIFIKEIQGKLYQMTYEQWYETEELDDLKFLDLKNHEIKPQQWYQIINNGKPELAIPLLNALSQFISNDDLQPYLKTALKRKINNNKAHLSVTQAAYDIWKQTYGWESAYLVRTNKNLRENIKPDVIWNNLFVYTTDHFTHINDAIEYLKNPKPLNDLRANDHLIKAAITKIYQHNDVDDLRVWMHDDEFSVALGSWLALHRIAPTDVATDVLEKALWWQSELNYTYGSGCVRMTGKLTPIIAALDLFSDYLSMDQIYTALSDAPEVWQSQTLSQLNVQNPQTYQALIKFGHQALDLHPIKKRQLQLNYQELAGEELYNFLNKEDNIYQLDKINFNQELLIYLSKQIKNQSDFNYNFYVYEAFTSKNSFAKQYLSKLINSNLPLINPQEFDDVFLRYQSVWPREWQDLKQQVIKRLQTSREEIKQPSLNLKLN